MDRQTDGQTEENMEMARRIVLTNASRALIIHKVHQTVGTIIVLLVDSGEAYYANQEDDFIFEDFARLRLKGYCSIDETDA